MKDNEGKDEVTEKAEPVYTNGLREITLPSGAKVTLRDPKLLRQKDRRNVYAAASGQKDLLQGLSIIDGLIAIMIDSWSFEFPPPVVRIQSLDELELADYDILAEEASEAEKIIFPSTKKTDKDADKPDSPFGR